ncbi:MAG TPA: NAD(P)-dependent oxidoreductase, partial [Methanotrichaceae archaeon]|nr:NAD(P)-dependent oxidoreductase [Methanotrichaceae archaeon]
NRLLAGKTIGVIGAGDIGKRVMQIAHSFNMNVISTTAHPSSEREEELGVKFVTLDDLLKESDIVTLHIPLTPDTVHMIDARELELMKPTAILINTSRGKIVNEEALIDTLRKKKIAGAALDVFEKEPLKADSPLMKLDNLVLTPHIAYLSEETTDMCADIFTENVEMFLKGKPQNVVNPGILKKGPQQN